MMHCLCIATCTDGDVRLVLSHDVNDFYNRETMYDSSYYDKNGLRAGRVELCVGTNYGTICDDGWDEQDASVVCRQLNLSPYGNVLVVCWSIDYCSCMSNRCYWSEC